VTLRSRLTLVLVALVGAGLLVSDVATYAALRSSLIRRVDQQLQSSERFALIVLSSPGLPNDVGGPPPEDAELPEGTYIALFDPSGVDVGHKTITYGETSSAPRLPSSLPRTGAEGYAYFTADAAGGGPHYRAIVFAVDPRFTNQPGYSVVVAVPLTEVDRTLRNLAVVAGSATVLILAAMALLSLWTVRRGLRPLRGIEETAGAIAGGDLSRRVEDTDPRTEVGRLGTSLNVMLGRIEEAMDERRASEEALRRFLADASHELRTPLTSIRGYAELFRRGAGADADDTALAMRRIEEEGERMGVLVDDLLFLARAGRGRPIASEPVDLAAVASDAVHDAQAVDPSRPIALDVPDGLVVQGDEPRLRQVLANLLANATTHTPGGTPVAVRVTAGDDRAVVEVSDRGPGLGPEEAAHVFEPFYRADPARERARDRDGSRGAGSGLGLAIVAAIAEAHGGAASVTSEPGRGATFTVTIPIARAGVEMVPEPEPKPAAHPDVASAPAEADSTAPDRTG
jgi:two-component system OmpR family sensor kinase